MKSKNGTVHMVAICRRCDVRYEGYLGADNARKKAYNHAKKTGHDITVEIGRFIRYNPKE